MKEKELEVNKSRVPNILDDEREDVSTRARELEIKLEKDIATLEKAAEDLIIEAKGLRQQFNKANAALNLKGAYLDNDARRSYEATVASYKELEDKVVKYQQSIEILTAELYDHREMMSDALIDPQKPTLH